MSFSTTTFRKITQDKLGISEPDPMHFGNGANPKSDKNWSNANWLKSRFHFNFAEWSGGPSSFGMLRVLNDDLVQPQRGFGTHGHANAEICTYVVDGELTHKDSMGTAETLSRGSIQFMTAGKGVRHSEFNNHPTTPLRFIQIWIVPRKNGLPPNYGSLRGDPADNSMRLNKWAWLVGDVSDKKAADVPVRINQDVNFYVTELDGGASDALTFDIAAGRQAYVLQIEGATRYAPTDDASNDTNSVQLTRHEAATVIGPAKFALSPLEPSTNGNSHVLVLEMQKI